MSWSHCITLICTYDITILSCLSVHFSKCGILCTHFSVIIIVYCTLHMHTGHVHTFIQCVKPWVQDDLTWLMHTMHAYCTADTPLKGYCAEIIVCLLVSSTLNPRHGTWRWYHWLTWWRCQWSYLYLLSCFILAATHSLTLWKEMAVCFFCWVASGIDAFWIIFRLSPITWLVCSLEYQESEACVSCNCFFCCQMHCTKLCTIGWCCNCSLLLAHPTNWSMSNYNH